ncbi:hypothetical protein EDD11_003081 [Mortierella claussenii]|nr:hypothetical protein EDD11_003081 [Mortierella claussenii]
MASNPSSTFELHQQLFADTLLKLQVHSALAKQNVQNNRSPLPLLAQSCALLDNLPSTSVANWTSSQELLINSLKIDAWIAFSDACIQEKDLIQAEASLHRLAALQEAAAGPLSVRASKSKRRPSAYASDTDLSTPSSPSSSEVATKEQFQAAEDLVATWEKLKHVYNDMGKQDMASNFHKRVAKMRERLSEVASVV